MLSILSLTCIGNASVIPSMARKLLLTVGMWLLVTVRAGWDRGNGYSVTGAATASLGPVRRPLPVVTRPLPATARLSVFCVGQRVVSHALQSITHVDMGRNWTRRLNIKTSDTH